MQSLISSELGVWTGGYRVRPNPSNPTVLWVEERHGHGELRKYDPFQEEPTAFYLVAHAEPTEAGVLEVVHRYGRLFSPHYQQRPNTLHQCQEAFAVLRWAVDLWEAVQSKDEQRAGLFVQWVEEKWPGGVDVAPHAVLPFPGAEKYLARAWPGKSRTFEATIHKKGREVAVCRHLLKQLIEYHTHRPNLDLFFVRTKGDEPAVEIHVDELITVLWMQLAQVVIGEFELRHCQQCGKPFILRQETRSDRVFCSSNCKVMSIYHRKRRARAMRAEGKQLREIVKEVGAPGNTYQQNLATVKRWLEEE